MHSLVHKIEIPLAKPLRADVYITDRLKLFPRSQLKHRLESLLVNGKATKPGKKVKAGDTLAIVWTDPPLPALDAEKMDLDILYEDQDVLVINKPQGLVVHPGAGNAKHTLVSGLLAHVTGLSEAFGNVDARPGIVHRLDKNTSGVLITAKHPAACEYLARQFRLRQTKKVYLALVRGRLPERTGVIETLIIRDRKHRKRFCAVRKVDHPVSNGKPSLTRYRVLKEWGGMSLVALRPETGRTHQLRVHMKYLGCPILGDEVYGKESRVHGAGLMLHAWKLAIRLPADGKQRVFRAKVPRRFKKLIRMSGRGDNFR